MAAEAVGTAAEWVLTFAIHGTVVLAVVWAVTRNGRVPEPVEEVLWRFALVGGLLTTALQLAAGGAAWGAIELEQPAVAPAVVVAELPASAPTPPAIDVLPSAAHVPASEPAELFAVDTAEVVLGLAIVAAVLGLARLGAHRLELRRALADRRPLLPGSPAVDALARLCARAGCRVPIRLTVSATLDAPVAFGVLRPEICVPRRALRELSPASRDAMLAHELAHVMRRDPLWLELAHTMRALFPWQPLLGVATRRLRALAEYRCDALGARLAGAVEVADCLVEVAGWLVEGKSIAACEGLVGMTVQRDGLRARVERLIGSEADRNVRRVSPLSLAGALGGATFAFAALLPGAAPRPVPGFPIPVAETRALDPLEELLLAVDAERDALRAEVAALRVEVQRFLPDAELSGLLAALDVRLRRLDQRRDALAFVIRGF